MSFAIDETCDIAEFDDWDENDQYVVDLMEKIDDHAKKCIADFFEDKEWYCGGKIPKKELFSSEKIDVVEQIELEDAFSFYHTFIDTEREANPDYKLCGVLLKEKKNYEDEQYEFIEDEQHTDPAVVNLLKLLRECAEKKVAHSRMGGIILIYLDVVAGIRIDWTNLNRIVRERKLERLNGVGSIGEGCNIPESA